MKQRFENSELMTLYLIPGSHKMTFDDVVSLNHDAINRLKGLERTNKVKSKINFIECLNHLIDQYCQDMKPYARAKALFAEYVCTLNPHHKKMLKSHTENVYEDEDTSQFLKKFILDGNNTKECFSGSMTPREGIQFWLDPRSVDLGVGDADLGYLIRYAAIQFLLFNKNQSSTERIFSKIKRSATPARNNLFHESAMSEAIIRQFKNNVTIFDRIGETADTKGKKSQTDDEKKLRMVYNFIIKFLLRNYLPINFAIIIISKNRSIISVMENSNITDYKKKILSEKSEEVKSSDLYLFFKEDDNDTIDEYSEDDTFDFFIKEIDYEKLIRFLLI